MVRDAISRNGGTSGQQMQLKRKLLLAVVSAVLASSTLAVAGEFAVRYRERHRSSVPGTMPFLLYRHGRFGHALVRNTDYFGWMRINRQGFRGADVSLKKPDGTFRIMAIGASTTFDTQVSSGDQTWAARLEYWLNQSDLRDPVEVINAGVGGWSPFQ